MAWLEIYSSLATASSGPPLLPHCYDRAITTGVLCSYGVAMKELGNSEKREVGRWANVLTLACGCAFA